jgi:hypothetical protein
MNIPSALTVRINIPSALTVRMNILHNITVVIVQLPLGFAALVVAAPPGVPPRLPANHTQVRSQSWPIEYKIYARESEDIIILTHPRNNNKVGNGEGLGNMPCGKRSSGRCIFSFN